MPKHTAYIFFKLIIDRLFSLMLICILLPLMIIIGILVVLDSKGPIFYLQPRIGKKGRVFRIVKFRTMIKDAENKGKKILIEHNDNRITRVGFFLRKASLDEIPQLFNIFIGDMSFIGPRPPVPFYPYPYENYLEKDRVRFTVNPGITGLAQIKGRNEISWEKRFRYDRIYINNVSCGLDLYIFWMTVLKVLRQEGIYE